MPFELSAFTFFIVASWAGLALWLGSGVLTLRGARRWNTLDSSESGAFLINDDSPLVSILVPARDEEHRVLRKSIESILAQDYERFEVVAVNDRSTDATGAILHSIASTNPKLRVIEGVEPPTGWLGKPHALEQAFRASHGEWILATDADMIFDPKALRVAVARALAGSYDAVTLIPHINCLSFWERVFLPTFGWYMLMALPLDRVNDPRRPEAIGIGGFFLIRRAVLESVNAYQAVKAEVAEDLRMAEILKSRKARVRVDFAPDLISTRMQTSLSEIWEGFTKNLFAGAKFSFSFALLSSIGILLFTVGPVLFTLVSLYQLATGGSPGALSLLVPNLGAWLMQIFIFALINLSSRVPVQYALTVPLGHILFVAILLNSTFRIAMGTGVTWKGRRLYERDGGVVPPRAGTALQAPDLPIADGRRK